MEIRPVAASSCLLLLALCCTSRAEAQATDTDSAWRALRLELGGSYGHAFPGDPCLTGCGRGLRAGSGWELRALLRWKRLGVGVVRESARFPWAIEEASYHAPGAVISTGATLIAFRAWLFERARFNPYLQLGAGSADYGISEPGGVCSMNPGTAWQGGVGVDVQVIPMLKYNVAWSSRTSAPEVICNWSIQHPSGVPVPPDFVATTHTMSMGLTVVLGDRW
jgi:hypothetical protein